MLALSFSFPGGRYHATPSDRHVNEGAVAWPPEPWRVVRALIATWHRKLKHLVDFEEATLHGLIEALCEKPPLYQLPPASHSHSRHYMPQWKAGDTSLVFDAFAVVSPEARLYMIWPDLRLSAEQRELLGLLLDALGYLGRAESWVEARVESEAPAANCAPGEDEVDRETGEVVGECVTLLAPLGTEDYRQVRNRFLTDRAAQRRLGSTLPERLIDGLSVETADLLKRGWSRPPAARMVKYVRPANALVPVHRNHPAPEPEFTTVRYVLVGKPLPRVEDSVRVGELMRLAVMSRAKKRFSEDEIPPVFSGHGLPASNLHGHAFYLPWDSSGDGRIDRIVIHVPAGVDPTHRGIIERVKRIWNRRGSEWRLVLESVGEAEVAGTLAAQASVWRSVTPYLHPWHAKKRLTPEDQIRRECRLRGLPEPDRIERLAQVLVGSQRRRPVHFHRFRSKRGLQQPDRQGSLWRVAFPVPVRGPLALGFACHYGLGLFEPDHGH